MSFMSAASTFSSIAFTVLLSMALSNPVNSQVLNANDWKVTFDTGKFGPVETTLKFTKKNGELIGHSVSGSREIIERLPKASRQKAQIGKYLLSFSLKQNVDKYEGNMIAPWAVGKVSLVFNDNGFKGKIKGGLFSGSFSGVLANLEQTPLRNYPNIIESFIKKVEERVFNPRALKDPVWKKLVGDMKQVGEFAMDDFDVYRWSVIFTSCS